jgi:hypothetical protein
MTIDFVAADDVAGEHVLRRFDMASRHSSLGSRATSRRENLPLGVFGRLKRRKSRVKVVVLPVLSEWSRGGVGEVA